MHFKKLFTVLVLLTVTVALFAQTSAKELEKKAKSADALTQYDIAHQFLKGEGVSQDDKRGLKWLINAAKTGDAHLQYKIAHEFLTGKDMPRDVATGEKWLATAAKNGGAAMMNQVADDYLAGTNVTKDANKAISWYTKAGKTDPKALIKIGDLYRDGTDVPKDGKKAISWYDKAAKFEHAALLKMGDIYVNGCTGVPIDLKKAIKIYKKAKDEGVKESSLKIGDCYVARNQEVRDKLATGKIVWALPISSMITKYGYKESTLPDKYHYLRDAMKYYKEAWMNGVFEGGDKLMALMEKEREFCRTYSKLPEIAGGGIEDTAKELIVKGNKEMYIFLGNYYAKQRRNSDAREQYNKALEAKVGDAKVLYRKIADSYNYLEWNQAQPFYEKAYNAGDSSVAIIIGTQLKARVDMDKENLVMLTDTDYDEARKWLNNALENKDNKAQKLLNQIEKRYADREKDPIYRLLKNKKYSAILKIAEEMNDEQKAIPLYEVCAKNGVAVAMRHMGDYWTKKSQNSEKYDYKIEAEETAFAWYAKAAEAGDIRAMESLAEKYSCGSGVAKDEAKANSWHLKAANKGDVGAMFNLGLAYQTGKGYNQNVDKALEWYKKAANAKDVNAIYRIAKIYIDKENYNESLKWFNKLRAISPNYVGYDGDNVDNCIEKIKFAKEILAFTYKYGRKIIEEVINGNIVVGAPIKLVILIMKQRKVSGDMVYTGEVEFDNMRTRTLKFKPFIYTPRDWHTHFHVTYDKSNNLIVSYKTSRVYY